MKKMKRVLSAILSFVLGMSSFMTAALAEEEISERVEISFKVGDSVLMINGEATEVETPYIAGEGTTLVPLRVITEAFGAEVTWVDETKEIYLEYPDVSIVLQIGNSEAKVNSHTETLPEAPALSPNGVTMVPLRFISETFGAEVGYDEKTAAITVVKEAAGEGDTMSAMNDMPRVGDSYYGWSMNTPKAMYMDEREFDGTYTEFVDENENYFCIFIFEPEDKNTVDQRFNELKERYSGKTLTMAEKSVDSNDNTVMKFRARDKEFNYGECVTETGKWVYAVQFKSKLGSDETAAMEELTKSFEVGFGDASITYDLSTVDEEGFRLFEDKEMKVSFKVPADCGMLETDAANQAGFISTGDIPIMVALAIYSKAEAGSAREVAEFDRELQKEYYNKTYVQVSGVSSYNKAPVGDNACAFMVTTANMPTGDEVGQSIYFEKGEYVYCLVMSCPAEKSSVIDKIANSLKVEELDKNEFGIAMRNLPDLTGTYKSSAGRWELTLPTLWEEITEPSSDEAIYLHKITGAVINFAVTDAGAIKNTDARDLANFLFDSMKGDMEEVEKNVTSTVYGGKNYYTYSGYVKDPDTGEQTYVTTAILVMNGKIYQFIMIDDALHHGGKGLEEFQRIIASLQVK